MLHTLTSLIVSVFVVFVHEKYSKNSDKHLINNYLDIKKVAEAEWRLSEGYRRLFMSAAPDDFTNAAETTIKAVVGVRAKDGDSFMNAPSGSHNSGSGVIINSMGYIVTNYHIVEDNAHVDVTFHDNRRVKGDVVGVDRSTDLALIKIAGETGIVCTLGGLPIYRRTKFTFNESAVDVSVEHDNVDQLRSAYAAQEKMKDIQEKAMQPNEDFSIEG